MLSREGIQPNHGNQRGPVAPVLDPVFDQGGDLGGGDPAVYRIIHDAGRAFVVWVHGSEQWLTGYIDTLPESVSDENFDCFLQKLAYFASMPDDSLRKVLCVVVLESLAVPLELIPEDPLYSETDPCIREGAITAPEFPQSALVPNLSTRVVSGLENVFLDDSEISERGLTP